MPGPAIAVVGAGAMGALHARVIQSSPRAELAVVVEPAEAVGRAVAERFGARWAPDLSGLDGADAVVVAAATSAHHPIALEVIGAGLPLLVEKPLADSLADSEAIVAAAAAADVPIMCGLLERYNSAVATAARLTRDPVHVNAQRHSPYAPRIRTGVAWDLLVHDVDIALGLLGDQPSSVAAQFGHFHPSSASDAEDVAEVQLGFPGGRLAALSASRIGQRKVRSVTITEVDRAIEVDLLRQAVTIYRHVAGEAATDDGLGYRQQTVIEIPMIAPLGEPLAAQLAHFVDLLEGAADPAAERAAILPAHRVVARAVESAAASARR
ncbi:Gfo/Idh/MocA family protein [Blastococcus xanthinilyticus]|uniref:Putative dehydrogenase n=1 Tax=Blastococcus xanthinilyticus TaxID=1564164 RepID=A0A5S5CK99_9ACTN|nr:Gfo/Idh/MocA family oxidoreductase [Blastococcus xanthinilyticus]TYP80679.1 putative dehydrogenase [Blastococcus xanthinilyticus]